MSGYEDGLALELKWGVSQAVSRLAIARSRTHLLHQLGEACLGLPADLLPRVNGVADQLFDVGGAE